MKWQTSAVSATWSSVAFTNTPVSSTRRCSCAPIASACSSVHTRGLPGQKIIPSAQAPRPAARWASSSAVIPQILTRVIARLSWQACG